MSELERDWREELLVCEVNKCVCEKSMAGKQNDIVKMNNLRYQTRHALVRLDIGCRV